MKACIRSLQARETPAAKALFVHLVKTGTRYNNKFVRLYLIRALSDPWCRTGQLVPASLALIKSNREAGQCIERAAESWPTALSKEDLFGTEGLDALATDDLLSTVLVNTPAAGPDFEHFLAMARRALLLDVLAAQSPDNADHAIASLLRHCASCHINERLQLHDRRIRRCLPALATQSPGTPKRCRARRVDRRIRLLFPIVFASGLPAPGGWHEGAPVSGFVLATSERAHPGK